MHVISSCPRRGFLTTRLEYLTVPCHILLQVVYAYDANETAHSESEIPWYQPLCGSFWSISGFRQTHLGRICTHGLVCTMELLRIAPKGSAQVRLFIMVGQHVTSRGPTGYRISTSCRSLFTRVLSLGSCVVFGVCGRCLIRISLGR